MEGQNNHLKAIRRTLHVDLLFNTYTHPHTHITDDNKIKIIKKPHLLYVTGYPPDCTCGPWYGTVKDEQVLQRLHRLIQEWSFKPPKGIKA